MIHGVCIAGICLLLAIPPERVASTQQILLVVVSCLLFVGAMVLVGLLNTRQIATISVLGVAVSFLGKAYQALHPAVVIFIFLLSLPLVALGVLDFLKSHGPNRDVEFGDNDS